MGIGLESFRSVHGDRLIIGQDANNNPGVQKAELKFGDRVVNHFRTGEDRYGTAQQRLENKSFKVTFFRALEKAEGTHVALRAARAAGLPDDWLANPKPMSERQVKLVLDKAQEMRVSTIRNNNSNGINYARRDDFRNAFTDYNANHNPPRPMGDANSSALHKLFLQELRSDPDFARRTFAKSDLDAVAQRAIGKFYEQKAKVFEEQHPGLTAIIGSIGDGDTIHLDKRTAFSELTRLLMKPVAIDPESGLQAPDTTQWGGESRMLRDVARDVFAMTQSGQDLLTKMEYDPDRLKSLGKELATHYGKLAALETKLAQVDSSDSTRPRSEAGQALLDGLVTEVRHQMDLLLAKASFIDDIMENDPLSQKVIDYSNLLWAHAAGKVFDRAIAYMREHPKPHGNDHAIAQLEQARDRFIAEQERNYRNAPTDERTYGPDEVSSKQHPATLGKAYAKDVLKGALKSVGMSKDQIGLFVTDSRLMQARQRALNENQDWAPIQRDMFVSKDGLSRLYRSVITPGGSISPRFARLYEGNIDGMDERQHTPMKGISSATKTDHFHARNLKLSELHVVDQNGLSHSKCKVIGHGVLDMWDIRDKDQRRQANINGAKEVLEAAITTNERIKNTMLERKENNNPAPVKVTHVSVNLITPAGWRELPGFEHTDSFHDYQEDTYTRSQFDAFSHHTTQANNGQPVNFLIDDDRQGQNIQNQGQDVDVRVDMNVIAFSFGINPIATGTVPDFMGGWPGIYNHNRREMLKFVGDLGTGDTGSVGARPGGFIGTILDRLEAADPQTPEVRELRTKIQQQADIVKGLFLSEDFKRGNGDPGKMARHILSLQNLAEETLSLLGVEDEAATMSKGCKSDKDRGGVVDVELKHQLITEDMGGEIRPDDRLEGDDQRNYYVVATGSGQLENQQYNTGLPGSKEAGKLSKRIPDKTVRQYLSGLAKFAAE